jgi:hypothetical protein
VVWREVDEDGVYGIEWMTADRKRCGDVVVGEMVRGVSGSEMCVKTSKRSAEP